MTFRLMVGAPQYQVWLQKIAKDYNNNNNNNNKKEKNSAEWEQICVTERYIPHP